MEKVEEAVKNLVQVLLQESPPVCPEDCQFFHFNLDDTEAPCSECCRAWDDKYKVKEK